MRRDADRAFSPRDPRGRVEEFLKATIDTAVATAAVRPSEFERVIVDSKAQEKAIAFPNDSRLLEIARHKVVMAAKAAGIALQQTLGAKASRCVAVPAATRMP